MHISLTRIFSGTPIWVFVLLAFLLWIGAKRLKPGVRGIPMQADRARRLVLLPGSVLPLLRILIIFGAHYVLRVAAAIHPDTSAAYLTWDIYVSGAGAGYFFGWSVRFLRSYRNAPQADLADWRPGAPG